MLERLDKAGFLLAPLVPTVPMVALNVGAEDYGTAAQALTIYAGTALTTLILLRRIDRKDQRKHTFDSLVGLTAKNRRLLFERVGAFDLIPSFILSVTTDNVFRMQVETDNDVKTTGVNQKLECKSASLRRFDKKIDLEKAVRLSEDAELPDSVLVFPFDEERWNSLLVDPVVEGQDDEFTLIKQTVGGKSVEFWVVNPDKVFRFV